MLSPDENGKIQGYFRPKSDFPVLFKADLIFKDFSSVFHACGNQTVSRPLIKKA